MKNAKYYAIDIAFRLIKIDIDNSRVYEKNGKKYELLDYYKLQQLLYILQGLSLALYDEPLFKDDIYNDEQEPMIKMIRDIFKEYEDNKQPLSLALEKYKNLDNAESSLEDYALTLNVYNNYAGYNSWQIHKFLDDGFTTPFNYITNKPIDLKDVKRFFRNGLLLSYLKNINHLL